MIEYDDKSCILKSQCKRKHLIIDKNYLIFVFKELLVVGESLTNPKYLVKFSKDNRILWKFNQDATIIRSFGIICSDKIKWFDSDHSKLMELKIAMGNKIFFGNISLFYDSQNIIGSGASCKVCQVSRKSDQTKFAAKCVSKKYLNSKNSNERLMRLYQEITILQQLQHKNFVNLVEIYQGENSYYLVTDLYLGDTLYRYIKTTDNITERQIINIMRQIFTGLEHLNQCGIIHRDIKLENILFEKQNDINSVKIIDLGLAVFESQAIKFSVCGTPGYIAPEILQAEDKQENERDNTYTHKCDIFSAGVILYKFLSRQTLFRAPKTSEILDKNKLCEIDFDKISNLSLVTDDALNLLKQLLAEDPQFRPSASDVLRHPYFNNDNDQVKTNSGYLKNLEKTSIDKQSDQKCLSSDLCFEDPINSSDDYIQKIPISQKVIFKKCKTQNLNVDFFDSPSPMKQRNHYTRIIHGEQLSSPYLPSFSGGKSLESMESPINQDNKFDNFQEEDFIKEWEKSYLQHSDDNIQF